MNQKKTGELIRSLRKERGLTQQQLACRMSISDKTVSKWERGAGSPDLSMFPLLSELFGVEIDVLLSGDLNSNFMYVPTAEISLPPLWKRESPAAEKS